MKKINFNKTKIAPSKIICIGRNYVDHIEELNNETPLNMVIFNKPNSAISDKLHFFSEDTRYEAEICFFIQNNKVKGISFGLDLTKANEQNYLKSKSLPWERSKSFDGSAVLGDFIEINFPLENIRLELRINDKLIQQGSYSQMIYKPSDMVEEISSFMSFEDGDIIMSGTPKGVGTYKRGDKFEGKIYCKDLLLLTSSWIVE